MKTFIKENWREIVGWLAIAGFAYIYLFEINHIGLLARRDRAFDFLVMLTIFVLGWLKLN